MSIDFSIGSFATIWNRGATLLMLPKITYICCTTSGLGNGSKVILNAMIKTLIAKKNSILPFGVLVLEFLAYKEVPKKNNDVI